VIDFLIGKVQSLQNPPDVLIDTHGISHASTQVPRSQGAVFIFM